MLCAWAHRAAVLCLQEAAVGVLASASYVLAWHCQGEAEPPEEHDDDFDDYARYARMARMGRVNAEEAIKHDGTSMNIPLAEVFEAVQQQRLHIMTWLRSAPADALDRVLSQVAGVSLRRGRLHLRNWEPSSLPALKCKRDIESRHPYVCYTVSVLRRAQAAHPRRSLAFCPGTFRTPTRTRWCISLGHRT